MLSQKQIHLRGVTPLALTLTNVVDTASVVAQVCGSFPAVTGRTAGKVYCLSCYGSDASNAMCVSVVLLDWVNPIVIQFGLPSQQGEAWPCRLPVQIAKMCEQRVCPFGDAALQFHDTVLAAETCEELFTPMAPNIRHALSGATPSHIACMLRHIAPAENKRRGACVEPWLAQSPFMLLAIGAPQRVASSAGER